MEKIGRIEFLEAKLDSMAALFSTIARSTRAVSALRGVIDKCNEPSEEVENSTTPIATRVDGAASKAAPMPLGVRGSEQAHLACLQWDNPKAWISQAKQYFKFHGTLESSKVNVALSL